METLHSSDPTRDPIEHARERVLDALDQLNQAIDRLTAEMKRAIQLAPPDEDLPAEVLARLPGRTGRR